MAFYRKKLKWYHRLWNIFGYAIGFVLISLYGLLGILPTYVIFGGDKVCDTAAAVPDTVVFKEY